MWIVILVMAVVLAIVLVIIVFVLIKDLLLRWRVEILSVKCYEGTEKASNV